MNHKIDIDYINNQITDGSFYVEKHNSEQYYIKASSDDRVVYLVSKDWALRDSEEPSLILIGADLIRAIFYLQNKLKGMQDNG